MPAKTMPSDAFARQRPRVLRDRIHLARLQRGEALLAS